MVKYFLNSAGEVLGEVLVENPVNPENLEIIESAIPLGFGYIRQPDGSFTAPPTPAPEIPQTVTALQGLLALDAAGLSSTYTAWAKAPERTFTQLAFIDKAQTWRRDDPTIAAAATDFGLTEQQVDALFVLAATL